CSPRGATPGTIWTPRCPNSRTCGRRNSRHEAKRRPQHRGLATFASALTWIRQAIELLSIETQNSWEAKVNFRSFFALFVLIMSASTACAQDAKKTADDFAAKWVAAYDAGNAAALAALFTQEGVFNAPSG